MKKLFCTFFVGVLLFSCSSVQTYNEQIAAFHPVKGLRKDVDKAYTKLQKLHPQLYTYISKENLDYKFDSLKKTITKPLSSRKFYEKLAPVVAEVRQGHIRVIPPTRQFTNKESKLIKKKKFEFYDLDFEYLSNALWIKGTRGADSTIIGNKVVKINNEPISEIIERYKKLFSSDGYNTTFQNRAVGLQFSKFYYIDKGYLDSLTITFQNEDSLFTKTFRRIAKDSISGISKIDSLNNKPKKLTKDEKLAQKLKDRQKRKDDYKYGYEKSKKRYTRNFNFIDKDSSIAYLKIRSFNNGKFKDFYQESFTKIDSAKANFLILDLRDNTGGRLAEIDKLYSYLTDKDYQLIEKGETLTRLPYLKMMTSKNNSSFLKILAGLLSPGIIINNLTKSSKKNGKLYFKFSSAKVKKPNPLNFKGDIYVLINGSSFSASSILSTNLHATKRATFIGEETGGAYNGTVAGIFRTIELPNSKVKMNIGLVQIEAPYNMEPNGFGIKPDIEIIPTIEDRKNNIDPELEWVLNTIQTKKGKIVLKD